MLQLSAWLGIVTGLILGAVETALNWGDWQWAPFFIVDYIAAALVLVGGVLTIGGAPIGPPLLTGGWGFTAGMAYMAFFSVYQQMASHQDKVGVPVYLGLIGLLVASAAIGLALAVLGQSRKEGANMP